MGLKMSSTGISCASLRSDVHEHHERHFLGDILDDDLDDCPAHAEAVSSLNVDEQEEELIRANKAVKNMKDDASVLVCFNNFVIELICYDFI